MKLRLNILRGLNKQLVLVANNNFQRELQFQDSPLRNSIPLKFGKTERNLCFECGKINFDWCWNCNKPICPECSFPLFFVQTNLILNLCEDCREELIKLQEEQEK
jgi:hypothetical protein